MAEENQHYIPKSHMRRFTDDGVLMELDKQKDIVERRGIEPAAAEINIYPHEFERGDMQKYDNDAYRILHAKVDGKRLDLNFTDDEKLKLGHWLLMFVLRTPSHRNFCGDRIANDGYNHDEAIKSLLANQSKYLRNYRQSKPDNYARMVARLGSKHRANQFFVGAMIRSIESGAVDASLTPEYLFQHMLTGDYHAGHLQLLDGLTWRWIHTEHEFVIGDNPLCRTKMDQANMNFNYGMSHPDILIHFPITKHLCLRLDRLEVTTVDIQINEEDTFAFNRMQIHSAFNLAWGPSVTALRPDGTVYE